MRNLSHIRPEQQQQAPLLIQPQLEIGKEDDEQEKEANTVADKVMKMPDDSGKIRMMSDGIEKPKMRDELPINMMKDTPVRKMSDGNGGAIMASPKVEQGISSSKGSGQSLPADTQQDLGGKMNADFSAVNVHTDSNAVKMNKEIGAKAFTHGNDIYFNSGQYNPSSDQGKHLLAHELTHTVQQGGNVQRKIQRQIYMFQKSDDPNLPADFWGTASGKMDLMSQDAFDKLLALLDDTAENPFKAAFKEQITGKDEEGNDKEYSFLLGKTDEAKQAYRKNLLKEIILNIHAVSNPMLYSDTEELILDVKKRFTIALDMRVTQGKSTDSKPTGYPERSAPEMGQGRLPRVNAAAEKYWNVHYATFNETKTAINQYYHFTLNDEGKNNAYKALTNLLFVHQTEQKLRSLMHCDYMIAAIQYKVMAEFMGPDKFDSQVKSGAIVVDLTWDGFRKISYYGQANETKENKSLMGVDVSSESELIIGDHVIFWNHEAYDDLNKKMGQSWRLENAIITGGSPGNHMFQGHGYFSPKDKESFKEDMVSRFNSLVKTAKSVTGMPSTDPNKKKYLKEAFSFDHNGSEFKVLRYEDNKWWIYFHEGGVISNPGGAVKRMELREVTVADYPQPFVQPGHSKISLHRPIESL